MPVISYDVASLIVIPTTTFATHLEIDPLGSEAYGVIEILLYLEPLSLMLINLPLKP